MSLQRFKLNVEIRKITDEQFILFQGFPKDRFEAANRWANAINNYGKPVLPISKTSDAATNAARNILLNVPQGGTPVFISALTTYATQLAAGMQPEFTGVPPIGLPVLEPIFKAGFAGASASTIANLLSVEINRWFKTGTAINNASGATINWN